MSRVERLLDLLFPSDIALDEYHNLRKTRSPDEDLEDVKHWAPALFRRGYHHAIPYGRGEVIILPRQYPDAKAFRRFLRHAAVAVAALPWLSDGARMAPRLAAATVYAVLERHNGVDAAVLYWGLRRRSGEAVNATAVEYPRWLADTILYGKPAKLVAQRTAELVARLPPAPADVLRLALWLVESIDAEHAKSMTHDDVLNVAAVNGLVDVAMALSLLRHHYDAFSEAAERLRRLRGEVLETIKKAKEEAVETAKKLLASGASYEEVEKTTGLSSTVIARLKKELEASVAAKTATATRRRRSFRHLSQEEVQKIVELYKQGKSIYAIAKELGRSTNTIYRTLKKLGLK